MTPLLIQSVSINSEPISGSRHSKDTKAHCENKHLLLTVFDGAPLQTIGSHDPIGFALPRDKVFEPLLGFLCENTASD